MLAWLLFACPKKGAVSVDVDPMAVALAARGIPVPYALRARGSLKLNSPDVNGTTSTAIVLHPPGSFRVEVYSPVGPPMLLAASDSDQLHAWVAKSNTFYRGDDANVVFASLVGGGLDSEDVVAVLTGRLPLAGAEPQDVQLTDAGVTLRLEGPADTTVHAVLDPSDAQLRSLRVDEAGGALLFSATYTGRIKAGDLRLPADLAVEVPRLDAVATLSFRQWDELGQVPDVFVLAPPPGATDVSLAEALTDPTTPPTPENRNE